MNRSASLYSHESDSRIMVKKDLKEVDNWTMNLELINEELNYLLVIEERLLKNPQLNRQLQELRRENQLVMGTLNRYEGTIKRAVECDTTECDAYYLHKHEKNRDMYLNHIREYHRSKINLFAKILTETKK